MNVAAKDVPSADAQSLIPVLKAKYMNRSPMLFGQPKQKFKGSAEAEFVPSPSHICNTDVIGWFSCHYYGLSSSVYIYLIEIKFAIFSPD